MKSIKMYSKILSGIFLISLIALFACEKDDDKPTPPPSGNGEQEITIKGSWLLLSEDVFDGPADQPCDAIIIEIEETEFMIFSFLESDPAAGHMGGYDAEIEDSMTLFIEFNYNKNTYNWEAMPDTFEHKMPAQLSSDGKMLTVEPEPGLELELVKVFKSVPEELVGTWNLEDNEVVYSTMEINSSGEFLWTDLGEGKEQGGILSCVGEVNDDKYLLSNITYCEFYADGESDYYTLNKYMIEDDELTIWHGAMEMVLVRNLED